MLGMAKMLLGIAKTETIEMLCLASSRKMQGRCVAGLRTDGQGWIRPVTAGADGTLHLADYRLPDGTEPRVLDTLKIGVSEPKPEPHQPENHQICRTPWQILSRPDPNTVPDTMQALISASVVKGPLLLGNFGDKCDYGPLKLRPAAASLALIAPDDLVWVIQPGYRGNRQTKAEFRLTRTPYCLSVTDPVWVQRLAHLPNGRYPREAAGLGTGDKVLFTVSLSEPLAWNNHCYKLVAGVIVLPAAL